MGPGRSRSGRRRWRLSPTDPPPAGRAGAWTPTPEQEHAVGRRGEPLLLAAGAGSGKTSVLVERFVRAVREDGIAPGRILAITFTERAAGELRERVRARLAELGEHAAARATEGAFCRARSTGSAHGCCARTRARRACRRSMRSSTRASRGDCAGRRSPRRSESSCEGGRARGGGPDRRIHRRSRARDGAGRVCGAAQPGPVGAATADAAPGRAPRQRAAGAAAWTAVRSSGCARRRGRTGDRAVGRAAGAVRRAL